MRNSHNPPRVLVCPLDWGIGHATRSVPVIRMFQQQGFEVLIAADGRPLAFLEKEFPQVTCIRFPGTHINYPTSTSMLWMMVRQGPRFLRGIFREHQVLERLVKQYEIDLVFSDNRFGAWSARVPSLFMTHQLNIQLPGSLRHFSPILRKLNYTIIGKYRECWIPDFPNHHGLAGDLSHPSVLPPNTYYIGPLSRFALPGSHPKSAIDQPAAGTVEQPSPETQIPPFEILILLSGPEPQRTILEEKLIRQVRQTTIQTILVRGITEKSERVQSDDNLLIYSHLPSPLLQTCLEKALLVICRSGYSSIMDITAMGKRAIFIPTPGQTEQEYLARYLMHKKIFFSMPQEQFDLLYALDMSINYPGMVLRNDLKELEERIKKWASGLVGQ